MSTVARITREQRLELFDEVIEYPTELEGGRNLIKHSLVKPSATNATISLDASEYVSKGVMRLFKSAKYVGIRIPAHPLLPNTEYVMSYRYKKTSGTLVSFGGHTDSSWSHNNAYVDGIKGGAYSGASSVFVSDDDTEHEVVVYINTPDEITAGHLIYIQPNRGSETPVSVDIYDLKLEKGNKVTPWTPAPEDLGYDFPPEITSFKPGISSGGTLLTPEIIEDDIFRLKKDSFTVTELKEGVDL